MRLSFINTGFPASWNAFTRSSIHLRSGTVFRLRFPVSAPMMAQSVIVGIPSGPASSNGSNRGSMLTKVLYSSAQNAFTSGPVVVEPYQNSSPFGSFPASASLIYRLGFFVRNR